MLLAILIFCAILYIIICILYNVDIIDVGEDQITFIKFSIIMSFIICLFFCVGLWGQIMNVDAIDKKIEMYSSENNKIEDNINIIIKNYMDDKYKNINEKDLVTTIKSFPELNSNDLIQSQISIYQNNDEKIKKLKEEKIDIETYKWWLYFKK